MLGRAFDDPALVMRLAGRGSAYSPELLEAAAVYLKFWNAEMVRRGVRPHDFVGPAMEFFGELLTEVLGQSKLA